MEQRKGKQTKVTQHAGTSVTPPCSNWRELKENIDALLHGNEPPHSDSIIQDILKNQAVPSFQTVTGWLNHGPIVENTKQGIRFKAKAQAYCERLKILDLRANLGASLVNKALFRSFHPAASLNGMNDWGKLEKALHLEVFEAEMRASRDPDENADEPSGSVTRMSHADENGNRKESGTPSVHSNYRESLLPDGASQPTHRELPPIQELLTEVDPCTTEKKRNPQMDMFLGPMGWQEEEEAQQMRSSKKFTQSFSASQILQYPNPREKAIRINDSSSAIPSTVFAVNSSLYLAQPNVQADVSGHEMQKIERALFRSDSDRGIDTDRELRVSSSKIAAFSKRESFRDNFSIRDLASLLQQKVQNHYFPNSQHQDILSRLLDNFFQVLDLAETEKEESPGKVLSVSNTNQKLGSNTKVLRSAKKVVETGKFAIQTCNRKLSRDKMAGGNDSFSIFTRNLPGIEKILGSSPKWKGVGYPVGDSPSKSKLLSNSQLSSCKRQPLQPVCTNSYIENEPSRGTDHLNSLSPSRIKEHQHSIYAVGEVGKDASSDCLDLSVLKNHNFSVDLISAFQ